MPRGIYARGKKPTPAPATTSETIVVEAVRHLLALQHERRVIATPLRSLDEQIIGARKRLLALAQEVVRPVDELDTPLEVDQL